MERVGSAAAHEERAHQVLDRRLVELVLVGEFTGLGDEFGVASQAQPGGHPVEPGEIAFLIQADSYPLSPSAVYPGERVTAP